MLQSSLKTALNSIQKNVKQPGNNTSMYLESSSNDDNYYVRVKYQSTKINAQKLSYGKYSTTFPSAPYKLTDAPYGMFCIPCPNPGDEVIIKNTGGTNEVGVKIDRNVSLRVKDGETPDSFEVSGRGELHLSVLIETMRREGFELLVSRPKVIIKEIDGVKCEPIERLVVNVPDDCVGNVIEKIGRRKGEMVNMEPAEDGHTKIEFRIPARGIIGYRTEFLTDTKGEGTMNSIFDCYEEYKGDIQARTRGTIVAFENGKSITYGLYNAQDKGDLFIGPGVEVYEGMIVGLNSRSEDLAINVCKEKHLTNTRASGSDEALRLVPPIIMSLEKAIEFIQDDELVEVTPESIRLRKKILNNKDRERAARANMK